MGIADRLKQEFPLDIEWLGFEIHPETPPEGMPLAAMFPKLDAGVLTRRLNDMAAPFGLSFRMIERISNSRLSLEASEFAKEHGSFETFHQRVFEAYFGRREDIGSIDVLAQIASDSGLDAQGLRKELQAGTYRPKLEAARAEAERLQVAAAPTFFFHDRERIVGAQPLQVFRELLTKMMTS